MPAPVGVEILRRTGIRAALAYLRIGAEPDRIRRADIAETLRRPSRRIARNIAEMLQRRPTISIAGIRRLARSPHRGAMRTSWTGTPTTWRAIVHSR